MMKTKITKMIALVAIMLLGYNTDAQTSLSLSAAGDSTWSGTNCPTPDTVNFYAWGNCSGYNPATDSIDVTYYFGDGTHYSHKVPIWAWGGSQSFYSNTNHIYTTPGLYSIKVVAIAPDGKTDSIIQKPALAVTDTCGNIKGKVYIDKNNNCNYDSGIDHVLKGYQVKLNQSGSTIANAWTDANGNYVFSAPIGIAYEVELVALSSSIVFACPASGKVAFTATANDVIDLGLKCNSGFDLSTNIVATRMRPRFNGYAYVTAGNLSCDSMAAILTVTLDPLVHYVSANPAPTTVSGNTLTWNLNMVPFSGWYYGYSTSHFYSKITFTTDSTAQIGDTTCFTSSITPTAGDVNTANNTSLFCGAVRNSWDPNMKEVSPAGVGAGGDISPNTELTYTIHFQNTGNDTAYNVALLDTLDANLDVSTLSIISSSHQFHTRLFDNNVIKFNFDNIMLVDSATNNPGSQGYVTYKIKVKSGLANGTKIRNTAHIFFDYNEAIVTNTTENTIAISLGLEEELNKSNFNLFPNPANNEVNIRFENSYNGTISLIDMVGKTVKRVSVNNATQAQLNVADVSKGAYIIRVDGNMNNTKRLMIIH